jgi:uncharacterized membrane protein YkvA (DUF1232 family)
MDEDVDTLVKKKKGILSKLFAWMGILLSVIYILNPTMGVFELIPDNLPIIGNLDEAGATALLISCVRYLGLDVLPFGKR